MIKAELEESINQQINQEFCAAYNYLGMATYFDSENLDGFAHWMNLQYQEELAHAQKLLRYLQDRGGRVRLETINSPRSEFTNITEVFKTSLAQEQANTASINKLYELATTLHDHATKSHLQWFIDEQVEGKSVEDVIALLERIGDDTAGLLYLDEKLGARTLTPIDTGA